jgi:hypothetical protein
MERVMKQNKSRVRIELTPEQRELVRKVTGKAPSGLELTAEALEERIAPSPVGAGAVGDLDGDQMPGSFSYPGDAGQVFR